MLLHFLLSYNSDFLNPAVKTKQQKTPLFFQGCYAKRWLVQLTIHSSNVTECHPFFTKPYEVSNIPVGFCLFLQWWESNPGFLSLILSPTPILLGLYVQKQVNREVKGLAQGSMCTEMQSLSVWNPNSLPWIPNVTFLLQENGQ